jgi:hypothetical protein
MTKEGSAEASVADCARSAEVSAVAPVLHPEEKRGRMA